MAEEGGGSRALVSLNPKDLLKQTRSDDSSLAEASSPQNRTIRLDNLGYSGNVHKFYGCEKTYVGNNILADKVTVHLPELPPWTLKKKIAMAAGVVSALLVVGLSVGLSVGRVTGSPSPSKDLEIVDGEDGLVADWYYQRSDLNLTECEEPARHVARTRVVVDSLPASCPTPEDCLRLIWQIGHDAPANFYLAGGRAYEGLGWNCISPNVSRDDFRVTFLWGDENSISQKDMASFNALLNVGYKKEISPGYDVTPSCCADPGSTGPSKGILRFLVTLAAYRPKGCVAKSKGCPRI